MVRYNLVPFILNNDRYQRLKPNPAASGIYVLYGTIEAAGMSRFEALGVNQSGRGAVLLNPDAPSPVLWRSQRHDSRHVHAAVADNRASAVAIANGQGCAMQTTLSRFRWFTLLLLPRKVPKCGHPPRCSCHRGTHEYGCGSIHTPYR
jgi:hypothetical protein